jgi:hypothetical protein
MVRAARSVHVSQGLPKPVEDVFTYFNAQETLYRTYRITKGAIPRLTQIWFGGSAEVATCP